MANCGNKGSFNLIRDDGVITGDSSQNCAYVLLGKPEYNLLSSAGTLQSPDIYPLAFCSYLMVCLFMGWIAGHQR